MTVYELLQKQAQSPVVPAPVQTVPAPINPAPATIPAPVPAAPAPSPVPQQWNTQGVAASLLSPKGDVLERAMLVTFSCSIPGNEKVDRKVTADVKRDKGMGEHAGKWDKTLFPPAAYKALSSVSSAVRSWHYANTLDWPMPGSQLLPSIKHGEYCKRMVEWRKQFDAARDAFLSKLPEIIDWARKEHNGSFDESLYDEAKLRAKFSFDIGFWPVPASNQFVGQLRDVLGASADAVDQKVTQAVIDAESKLWERLITKLQVMRDILVKKDSGEQTRVTESLLDNLREVAEQIPTLNLNDNPHLAQFCADTKQAFASFSKKSLAEDKKARQDAVKAADDILRRMTGFSR